MLAVENYIHIIEKVECTDTFIGLYDFLSKRYKGQVGKISKYPLYYKNKDGILDSIVKYGFLEHLKSIQNEPDMCFESKIEIIADNVVLYGHAHIMKWMEENNISYQHNTSYCKDDCSEFAKSETHYPIDIDVVARDTQLNIVQWLHKNGYTGYITNSMDYAATCGQLDIVKWLHENRKEGCTTYAMDGAAGNGHLNVVKWLHENRDEGCTDIAMIKASLGGYLDVVKWLYEHEKCIITDFMIEVTARHGHIEISTWLYNKRKS